jgi:hypothetical protein
MTDLRSAARQALGALKNGARVWDAMGILHAALEQPERTLTDEVIADLWHQNGGFHHHFARAVERYLKGEK